MSEPTTAAPPAPRTSTMRALTFQYDALEQITLGAIFTANSYDQTVWAPFSTLERMVAKLADGEQNIAIRRRVLVLAMLCTAELSARLQQHVNMESDNGGGRLPLPRWNQQDTIAILESVERIINGSLEGTATGDDPPPAGIAAAAATGTDTKS